ncbi:bifunctional hydroxymethylpyrimidine kinase/phosphomethylpyrimidine kinase [Caproicibacter sp.]|uniref:bifunctional hydroxymethylpyrimidine kinase/phosphomethylpyrimidine kinase n=1 Tax=Caproicibacter sp. TaxID=2814884 RepID=UPI003988BCBE
MSENKRAALIGSVCETGKCSLAAALPVLAAACVEVCVAPMSAAPSPGPETEKRVDLSGDLPFYAEQWKKLGYSFDAVLFELPENAKEADTLASFLHTFREKDNLILFGSSSWRGNGGKAGMTRERAKLAEQFCSMADLVILPACDAAFLMGERERVGPWNRRTVEDLLRGICSLGAKSAVMTGVWFSPDLMGTAAYTAENGSVSYAFSHRISGEWMGAGDLFCAALLAGLLYGMHLSAAMQLAVDFTADCIRRTRESGEDGRLGLKFEACLPKLINQLGIVKP